jgi:HSP20 family protein
VAKTTERGDGKEHREMALSTRRNNDAGDSQEQAPTLWDPIAELERQFARAWGQFMPVGESAFVPLSDISETDDSYVVELDLPGVRKEDIEISLSGRRLTVSGDTTDKERAGVLRRRGRRSGHFYFEVVFPGDVEEQGVTASLDDGVLSIRVPKASAERPRRIEVS